MKIVAQYDFNGGKQLIAEKYSTEFSQIESVIAAIDASCCKTKESAEKTMRGKLLFSPVEINATFKEKFDQLGWSNHRVDCNYTIGEYFDNYIPAKVTRAHREMDFIKHGVKLGVEVQFGKYAFMVYNVCAKMTIFSNLGVIDAGVEIVPVKNFADEMSTGVSYFEQFAWDLHHRGVSNIDIPVLILGIDA